MIVDAYIDLGEFRHALVIKTCECTTYIKIHSTGKTPPPIDPQSTQGRQMTWLLRKIKGEDAGEFPNA